MITGIVNEEFEPIISISLYDSDGNIYTQYAIPSGRLRQRRYWLQGLAIAAPLYITYLFFRRFCEVPSAPGLHG